jgi:arylesterase/paraoxonase
VKFTVKPWLVAIALLAAIALVPLVELLRFGGMFRGVSAEFAGACRAIALAASVEDIQIDRKRGLAYLSYLDRAAVRRGEDVAGTVMLLDLNLADPQPRAALAFDPAGFRPHGLSLVERANEPTRLFAVSHPADGTHAVEIFAESSTGGFFHKETIRSPLFDHPNALAAVGVRQFYLANDSGTAGKLATATDVLLRRGHATLVYYDGFEARVVDDKLRYPAGIALSPDTSRLYVAEAMGKQLRVYKREPATGAVELEEIVPLDTAPDNLNVDEDGVVWIAAHPKLLAFLAHVDAPKEPAPTQVLRFDPAGRKPAEDEKDTRLTQVFLDPGERISAGTVAASWRNEFLIGPLLEHKVLICKPKP